VVLWWWFVVEVFGFAAVLGSGGGCGDGRVIGGVLLLRWKLRRWIWVFSCGGLAADVGICCLDSSPLLLFGSEAAGVCLMSWVFGFLDT
jgi:hypothetical protein